MSLSSFSLPSLAIVVVSYNSNDWLEQCLSSLLSNIKAYSSPVELALVENGNAADTETLARRFAPQGLKWLPAPAKSGLWRRG